MAKNKNRRRETSAPAVTVTDKIPLVSVIIPMYNSAKFIPQTLESLLYQTMTDFEVVVVDDCSTDNSVEVVESFAERFNVGGGCRLHVIKLRENTGTPGLPRNVGIQYARGKYIAFLDSDDLYTKTALEELSTLAEDYQADIVNLNCRFHLYGGQAMSIDDPRMTDFNELTNPKNFTLIKGVRTQINTIQFESNNFSERMRKWINWEYRWGSPTLFCKRDFLTVNQICFTNISMFEDMSFFFECLCKASKFLRVPNVTYIVRPRVGSATRGENTVDIKKTFADYFRVSIGGFKDFERMMDKIPFFKEHADYRYTVLNFFFHRSYGWPWSFQNIYMKVHPAELYPLIKKEFSSDDASLAAYLFNTVNVYRLQIARLQQELSKFHS